MRRASHALATLLVPFAGWYLLAPAVALFGWTRRAFMRFSSRALLLLAVLSASGELDRSPSQRVAWGVAWLVAAAIGFRLSRCSGIRLRSSRPDRDPHQLVGLCERRIGRQVDAAARLRVKTPAGARTHALALAAGYLWWIELRPWSVRLGPIFLYRPLHGLAAHTEQCRGGRHPLELSWPSSGELFLGTLYGSGADRLAGLLAAEQFARARASASRE